MRSKIIVSADDFGIRSVSQSILPLARTGKIDRVSVLIRYVTSEQDIRDLIATGVKIDLHLELIQLVGSGENPTQGALSRGLNFMMRYALGKVRTDAVEQSWMEQIVLFHKRFGRYPDGLNSHEHLHYFPRFFRVATTLAERYRIPFVRFARLGILRQRGVLVSQILDALWKRDKAYYDKRGGTIRDAADFFVSYDWISDLPAFLKKLPEGSSTEIVFHPERDEEYVALERL